MHPIGNIQHLLIVLIRPDGLNPLTPSRAFLLCGETGGTFVGAFLPWIATVGTIVAGWVMPFEGRRATADTYPRCGETGGTFGGAFSLRGATVGTFVAGWVIQSEGRSELLILTHVVVKLVAPLLVLFSPGCNRWHLCRCFLTLDCNRWHLC